MGEAVLCLCSSAACCARPPGGRRQRTIRAVMFTSRRLKYRDYSAPGLYFVTVCSDFKRCTFGDVVDKKVELSPLGRIVEEAWLALSSRIFGIRLHAHVVMPNHIHGIVEIVHQKMAQQAAPRQRATGARPEVHTTAGFGSEGRRTPSLSIIVRSFKADVTRRAGVELEWKRGNLAAQLF
jgi:putative transposase